MIKYDKVMIIHKKFQNIVSTKYQLLFSIFLIIYKEFLHGFPFLYISSIEGRELFREIFVVGIRIVTYSPTPKQNTTKYINS